MWQLYWYLQRGERQKQQEAFVLAKNPSFGVLRGWARDVRVLVVVRQRPLNGIISDLDLAVVLELLHEICLTAPSGERGQPANDEDTTGSKD